MGAKLFLACPVADAREFTWQNADGSIEVSGRAITAADFTGAPGVVPAERIVPTIRRSQVMGGNAGAIQLPHPHQQTIYPASVVAEATGEVPFADLVRAAENAVSAEWQITLPKGQGFRRNLALPNANKPMDDDPPGIFEDFHGRVRHLGRNEPCEFEQATQDVPNWPHDLSSAPLRFAGKEPTSLNEAVQFGKQLDQVMSSISNLSLLWNRAKRALDDQSPYGLAFLTLTNINALVESAIAICEGTRTNGVKRLLLANHRVAAAPWNEGILAMALQGWFPANAPFTNAFANLTDEVTAVVGFWQRFRNGWAHEPPPLNASPIEYGSLQRVLVIDEAKRLAASSYLVGYRICQAAGTPPLNALESVDGLPTAPDPDAVPDGNVVIRMDPPNIL